MAEAPTIPETFEFRVVLVDPTSYGLLALDTADGYRLPRVQIPRWLRPAQQLRKEIQATWGVRVMILPGFISPCTIVSGIPRICDRS